MNTEIISTLITQVLVQIFTLLVLSILYLRANTCRTWKEYCFNTDDSFYDKFYLAVIRFFGLIVPLVLEVILLIYSSYCFIYQSIINE